MEAAGAGSEVLQEAGGDSFEDDVWLNASPYLMEPTRQSDRFFSEEREFKESLQKVKH